MKFRDYYEILGVAESATADEIKRAYRKKARQFHPDVSKEDDAEEKFKLVAEAYEVLRDPVRRGEYDQLKKQGYRNGEDFQGGGNWQGQWKPGADAFSQAGDFSEFFNSIFGAAGMGNVGSRAGGGGFTHGFESTGRPNARAATQGSDIRLRVRVSLEMAYKGGKTKIEVPAKQGAERRSLSVTIPAGVVDGQQLRLRRQGGRAPNGGLAGDLLLSIEIKKHELFEVDGADVLLALPLTPLESVKGVTLAVPTPGGEVSLTIPPNTISGTRLRLRGRGLPAASSRGNQYVTVQIVLPEKLSAGQLKLLHEFDALVDDDPRSRLWPAETV